MSWYYCWKGYVLWHVSISVDGFIAFECRKGGSAGLLLNDPLLSYQVASLPRQGHLGSPDKECLVYGREVLVDVPYECIIWAAQLELRCGRNGGLLECGAHMLEGSHQCK